MASSRTQRSLPPAIFLMGPTASGKTDLAIKLCQQLPCDIISVDSALIYRDMNIGTAKPTASELRQAPHRLIDILDPAESYSAMDFRRDALREMQDISASGRIPLLVGGTMLYFKALLEGLADMPAADPVIRADIEQTAATYGWPYVHAQLADVDPESAARIHPNHSQRIERALEVYRATGISMTKHHQQHPQHQALPYDVIQLAIAPLDRAILHDRIAQRFELMLQQGLVAEVEALHRRADLHLDLPAIRAVGYRQVWQYLDGELDYQQMIERGVIATRQLAKRQFTWLNGWTKLRWMRTDAAGMLVANNTDGTVSTNDLNSAPILGEPALNLALKYLRHLSS